MRKIVLIVLVVGSWFVYQNRMRLFVRDPLGLVTRNGVKEDGAQVFINYDNDALLENDHAPMYLEILQHGQPVGTPNTLKCIHYLVCLASGYPAPQASALPGARMVAMSPKIVQFRDEEGREVAVALR